VNPSLKNNSDYHMSFILDHVFPLPLKDRLGTRVSGIWGQYVVFEPGKQYRIKAPSGTGKTTLIHMMYRMRSDYEGSISFNGRNIDSFNHEEIALNRQWDVSIVFQDLRLFPQLTIRENIELKRILTDQPFEGKEAIEEMARMLGISNVLDQKAGTCSYGEQQRAAVIRSLMQPFQWILLDEPFSHLDEQNKTLAARLIKSACEKRKAGMILFDLDRDDLFIYDAVVEL
jgi:putative ABC transport system ATP-binding protein